jgi:hypothetical protein
MRALTLCLLIFFARTLPGDAQQVSDSDAAAKIVVLEHIWSQAYVLKDSKTLEKMLDDSFVKVESDGRLMTKVDVLAEVESSSQRQVVTESILVRVHGATAIVTGIFLKKGIERGKPFVRRERFVDTWLCKNGEWVALSGLATPTPR